jgi:hypothetical protein
VTSGDAQRRITLRQPGCRRKVEVSVERSEQGGTGGLPPRLSMDLALSKNAAVMLTENHPNLKFFELKRLNTTMWRYR